jgi:hypothetical protein
VRGDLAAGVDFSVGPGLTGGWYLVGLSGPHGSALDLLEAGAERERTFALAAELSIGLLRAERLVRTETDCYAMSVDPLVPKAVQVLIR